MYYSSIETEMHLVTWVGGSVQTRLLQSLDKKKLINAKPHHMVRVMLIFDPRCMIDHQHYKYPGEFNRTACLFANNVFHSYLR